MNKNNPNKETKKFEKTLKKHEGLIDECVEAYYPHIKCYQNDVDSKEEFKIELTTAFMKAYSLYHDTPKKNRKSFESYLTKELAIKIGNLMPRLVLTRHKDGTKGCVTKPTKIKIK
jgi:hypothetical protein